MGRFSSNIVANYLMACARYNPDGEVIVYGDRRVRWGELRGRVTRLARALIRLGVSPGDKVAFMLHNCPEFVELNYACQMAGAVPVPINYRYTAPEARAQIDHCEARVLVYEPLWSESIGGAVRELSLGARVCIGEGGLPGSLSYQDLVSAGEDEDPNVRTGPDDVAAIIYTGGTTGRPKGVMLSYGAHLEMFANLLASVIARAATLELSDTQRERLAEAAPIPGLATLLPYLQSGLAQRIVRLDLTRALLRRVVRYYLSHPEVARLGYRHTIKYMVPSMPLFHGASYQVLHLGLMVGNLCYLFAPGVSFDPERILEMVEREQPRFMANVPTGWKKLVSCPELGRHDVSSVRVAATGAGACSVALKQRIFASFPGILIIDMFGQTEMTPTTAFRIDAGPGTLKERAVGASIVESKILDDEGRELPPGQVGEICYRSSTAMKGYYRDAAATRSALSGGWLRSGDLGYLDEEGDLRLVDRKAECINTGGEKVFPQEVEEVIHLHPGVEEACVIGVPDEEWGSSVTAVVQPKPGHSLEPDEIIAFCRQTLGRYKVPRAVIFVGELPLSAAGKVQRARVRELYGRPRQ